MATTFTLPAPHERTLARRWLAVAVVSLVLAGALALLLAAMRTPGLSSLGIDPLLCKRGLVVHVVLALVVWFYAFVAGLFSLIPSERPGPLSQVGPWVGALGVVLLLAGAAVPGAQPVLSNYIPMVDHPVFAAGLLVFTAGVAFALFDPRLLPPRWPRAGAPLIPEQAQLGLRTAAVCLFLALLTFFASGLGTPRGLDPHAYYELLFWGGGHVLQFASVAAMLAAWIILLTPSLGRSPLRRPEAVGVFFALLLPALAAPLLAMQSPTKGSYLGSFTTLMQWGIFPAVLAALALISVRLWRAKRRGELQPGLGLWGFFASAGLTVLGFLLGALIRGPTTLVPAHYHASIGGVTAAFMATAFLLLSPLGMPLSSPRHLRLARLQPVLFGVGQAVFALGFGWAGAHGTGRKIYGAEQVVRSTGEWIGLGVMGVGGLVASAAGVLFLVLVIASWRRARGPLEVSLISERSRKWTLNANTPSRS
jgi:cytochrome c oxidase subunit I